MCAITDSFLYQSIVIVSINLTSLKNEIIFTETPLSSASCDDDEFLLLYASHYVSHLLVLTIFYMQLI